MSPGRRTAPPLINITESSTFMTTNDEEFTHIVMVDIAPEHERAFNKWYVQKHFPDLLSCPGWLSASRYINLGEGPKYVAMYSVAGQWAFETEDFIKAKGFGPFTDHVRNFKRIQLKPI